MLGIREDHKNLKLPQPRLEPRTLGWLRQSVILSGVGLQVTKANAEQGTARPESDVLRMRNAYDSTGNGILDDSILGVRKIDNAWVLPSGRSGALYAVSPVSHHSPPADVTHARRWRHVFAEISL